MKSDKLKSQLTSTTLKPANTFASRPFSIQSKIEQPNIQAQSETVEQEKIQRKSDSLGSFNFAMTPRPAVNLKHKLGETFQTQPLSERQIRRSPLTLRQQPLPITSMPTVMRKLTIGAHNDKYEQEADRVAEKVVSKIHGQPVQRKALIQAASSASLDGGEVDRQWAGKLQSARGGGQPLVQTVREPMETAFGADFSGVRVHTGLQADVLARSIQAKAFTTGQDVFFRQGAYAPESPGGQKLIAHELTHVVQQKGANVVQRDIDNNTTQKDLDDLIGMSYTEIEAKLVGGMAKKDDALDFEVGVITDAEGKAQKVLKGESRSVSVLSEEKNISDHGGEGILTHNHPSGSALTVSDLSCAFKLHNLKTVRAVGKFGVSEATNSKPWKKDKDGKSVDPREAEIKLAENSCLYLIKETYETQEGFKDLDDTQWKSIEADIFVTKYWAIEWIGQKVAGISVKQDASLKEEADRRALDIATTSKAKKSSGGPKKKPPVKRGSLGSL